MMRSRIRPALLACLPFLATCLLTCGTHATAQATEITIAVEPGKLVHPEEARGPVFLVDSQGLLVVIEPLQAFVLGHFAAPPGLRPESPDYPGGVALEEREFDADESSSVPQTSLPTQSGFPFTAEGALAGSPCLVDLEGDGHYEIVAATTEGTVYVIAHTGRTKPGWPKILDDRFYAPPSAADIDGDGTREIVLGSASGRIYAWRTDGSTVPGWPLHPARDAPEAGIFGAAALVDLDGDGACEICAAAADGSVHLLGGDGRPLTGWPQYLPPATDPPNPSGIFSSPAVGDLDGDDTPEIIVATNAYRIHAWHRTGEPVSGWPVDLPHRARAGYGDVALGDVNGDGTPEVIAVSEHGFAGPATVSVFAPDGSLLPGWPRDLPESANAGVALGDLTGDGVAEIVVATIGGDAAVIALDGRDARALPGWPVRLKNETINASPVIADLDGDEQPDILLAALSTEPENHTWLWALNSHGAQLRGFPILLPDDEIVRGGPAVADLDGDGDLELIVATELQGNLHVWDLPVPCHPELIPWPSVSGGPARSGCHHTPGAKKPAATPAIPEPPRETSSSRGPTGGIALDEPEPAPRGPQGSGTSEFSRAGHLSTVSFDLREETDVFLGIFSIQGGSIRHLLDHCLPPGRYAIRWDGRDDVGALQPSGIYFYQLSLDGRATTRQLLLLK
jgi:hypothetical protein